MLILYCHTFVGVAADAEDAVVVQMARRRQAARGRVHLTGAALERGPGQTGLAVPKVGVEPTRDVTPNGF